MNISLNDSRDLAVAFLDPVTGLACNPASRAMEPFDPTVHLIPVGAVPMRIAAPPAGPDGKPAWTLPPALFGDFKTVSDGPRSLMRGNRGLVPTFFEMGADGLPTAIEDVASNSFAVLFPGIRAGISR